jgi:DNA-binding Xre family transcriptional regulator
MELKDAAGISAASIAKLGKGGNITTDVLLKICETLDCKVEDIIETIVDKKGNGDDESSKEKQRL